MLEVLHEKATVNPQAQPRPTIVCIDDDPDISQAVTLMLSKFDVEVVCACNGEQGIWEAVTHDPALIITDLRMPQGTGKLVLECLHALQKTRCVPIVVLTGLRDPHLERQVKRLGAASYLMKPVSTVHLLDEIRKHVALREREDNRHSIA